MNTHILRIAAGAFLLLALSATAHAATCAPAGVDAAATPTTPKKSGGGLRSLLSAAKRAGVADLLGGDAFGRSAKSQAAGALVGAAVGASDGTPDAGRTAAALGGNGRTARMAGAVAGVGAELARARPAASGDGPRAAPCTPAPPAAPAAVWN